MRDKIEDVVEDGVTGLIIPEKNPVALANALQKLADDDKLRQRLGENARQKYISQFDRRKSANQVLEIYKSLIA